MSPIWQAYASTNWTKSSFALLSFSGLAPSSSIATPRMSWSSAVKLKITLVRSTRLGARETVKARRGETSFNDVRQGQCWFPLKGSGLPRSALFSGLWMRERQRFHHQCFVSASPAFRSIHIGIEKAVNGGGIAVFRQAIDVQIRRHSSLLRFAAAVPLFARSVAHLALLVQRPTSPPCFVNLFLYIPQNRETGSSCSP